jgi:UDP:flavonoid glycosyltransferase YjiC (YdhE family)
MHAKDNSQVHAPATQRRADLTGPPLPELEGDRQRADVLSLLRRDRPVVLVTQGAAATDLGELVEPALAGLAGNSLTVVATGGAGPAGLNRFIPSNALVAPYLPFKTLMPHVSVMVTNGGIGGVQSALAHGVPLVIAGTRHESSEVAARIVSSGVGLLATRTPSPDQVRRAVHEVLTDPRFRRRAVEMRREIARVGPACSVAHLIERLVRSGAVTAPAEFAERCRSWGVEVARP